MKKKFVILIMLCVIIISCNNKKNERNKHDINKETKVESLININEIMYNNFDIFNFKTQLDSLLTIIEHKNFKFDLKSDTLNKNTDKKILYLFGNRGHFNLINPDSVDMLIINHFYESKTKKVLRIYLIEAISRDTIKSKILFQKLNQRKHYKEEFLADDGPVGDSLEYGLTLLSDYVIRKRKKLYWLNVSCQYSKNNFTKIINLFKSNLDQEISKDTIKCYCQEGCY